MKLHIIFGQRRCIYPGQHAPEALDIMDEFGMEVNSEWFEERLVMHRKSLYTGEFSSVAVVVVDVPDEEITKRLSPEEDPVKGTVVSGLGGRGGNGADVPDPSGTGGDGHDWEPEAASSPLGESLVCSVCGEPQFNTPGGACCRRGHGGASGWLRTVWEAHQLEVQRLAEKRAERLEEGFPGERDKPPVGYVLVRDGETVRAGALSWSSHLHKWVSVDDIMLGVFDRSAHPRYTFANRGST